MLVVSTHWLVKTRSPVSFTHAIEAGSVCAKNVQQPFEQSNTSNEVNILCWRRVLFSASSADIADREKSPTYLLRIRSSNNIARRRIYPDRRSKVCCILLFRACRSRRRQHRTSTLGHTAFRKRNSHVFRSRFCTAVKVM